MKSLKLKHVEIQSFDDHFIIKDSKKFTIIAGFIGLLLYLIKSVVVLSKADFDIQQEMYYFVLALITFTGLVIGIIKRPNFENKISKKDIKEITQKKAWFTNEEITIHYGDKKRKFIIRENDGHQVLQFFRENRN